MPSSGLCRVVEPQRPACPDAVMRHNPPPKTEDASRWKHHGAPGGWTPCQLSARARPVRRNAEASTVAGHRVFAVLQPRNGGRIMPNSLERHLDGVRAKSRRATRTRHNPAFGITAIMPHAALAAHLRSLVPRRRWRTGADPVSTWARFGGNDGAISGVQTTASKRR